MTPTNAAMSASQRLQLSGFIVALLLVVVAVYYLTAERIADARLDSQRAVLAEVFPAALHDNDLLASAITLDNNYVQLELLQLSKPRIAYRATLGARPAGVILPLEAPDGYGGVIVMHVGIKVDGTLTGVRVLQHNETAGLGDKIDLVISPWIHSFDNRSLDDTPDVLWHIKQDGGDFDQFVGATVTPRAVVAAVHNALLFFDANQALLLGGTP
jgi:electron transport complex protein RnfG